VEKFAAGGTNCRFVPMFRNCEGPHIVDLSAMARRLLPRYRGHFPVALFGALAMLPAIGASVALDALQSLTSPQSSASQAIGGFDLGDDSTDASSASGTLSGFSSAQISSDNLDALIGAQSLASGDLGSSTGSGNPTSDPSQDSSGSLTGAASSAYNSINQLAQTTAIPLGLSISA
jgi:hypothetical protein